MITESDNGRAFEVLPDGKIVWELYDLHRVGDHDQFIVTLLQVDRLPADFAEWLHAK